MNRLFTNGKPMNSNWCVSCAILMGVLIVVVLSTILKFLGWL